MEEKSKQYIKDIQPWETDFKNAVYNFLISNVKKCLLIETESSKSGVIRVLQTLKELKDNPQHREALEKYLISENQTFVSWTQFLDLVKPSGELPKLLTNLLVHEFPENVKIKRHDGEVLKKLVDCYTLSASKKVIFITSQKRILNKYLENMEMRDLLKIDEFNEKVTSWIYEDETEALYESASRGQINDITELLKYSLNINSTREDMLTPIEVAAENGHHDIVLMLLKNGANISDSEPYNHPLHLASRKGHTNVVLVLLKNGVDVNIVDDWGQTALHEAASNGHTDVVNILLEHQANVNIQSEYDSTPLHFAVCKKNVDVVKTLLNYGARIDIKNDEGATPIHMAALFDNLEVIRILIEKGAKLNDRNNQGQTPLDLATQYIYLFNSSTLQKIKF